MDFAGFGCGTHRNTKFKSNSLAVCRYVSCWITRSDVKESLNAAWYFGGAGNETAPDQEDGGRGYFRRYTLKPRRTNNARTSGPRACEELRLRPFTLWLPPRNESLACGILNAVLGTGTNLVNICCSRMRRRQELRKIKLSRANAVNHFSYKSLSSDERTLLLLLNQVKTILHLKISILNFK